MFTNVEGKEKQFRHEQKIDLGFKKRAYNIYTSFETVGKSLTVIHEKFSSC